MAPRTGKAKPIFRGLTIAAAGDLNNRPGGSGQWTDTNIARWVGLRDGVFVRPGAVISTGTGMGDGRGGGGGGGGGGNGIGNNNGNGNGNGGLGEEVTHLVCSKEEFRRMGRLVKEALKRKSCEIVTLDWLEDSIFRNKRLPEEPYSHRRALERERKREQMRLKVIKGLEKAVKEVNPNLYHLYRDSTFFQYEVTITRDDEEKGIPGERYVLSLYESNNSRPHLYWFVAKFYRKKGDSQPKIYRPSIAPGILSREFGLFESFFQTKTGIPWAQRLIKAGKMGKSFFQYQPPRGGKPVGWVPPEFIPPESPDTASQPATTIGTADTNGNETAAAADSQNGSLAIPGEHGSNAFAMPSQNVIPHSGIITPAPSPRSDGDAVTPADSPQSGEEAGPSSPQLPTPTGGSPN